MNAVLRLAAVALLLGACDGEREATTAAPSPEPVVATATGDAAAKVPTDEIELIVLGMT